MKPRPHTWLLAALALWGAACGATPVGRSRAPGTPAPSGPQFHFRVRVASRVAAEVVLPDARSVGFLPDGSLLVMPFDRPSDAPLREPLRTLAERRCGLFSAWKPSQP
jgi:hypothetical protein